MRSEREPPEPALGAPGLLGATRSDPIAALQRRMEKINEAQRQTEERLALGGGVVDVRSAPSQPKSSFRGFLSPAALKRVRMAGTESDGSISEPSFRGQLPSFVQKASDEVASAAAEYRLSVPPTKTESQDFTYGISSFDDKTVDRWLQVDQAARIKPALLGQSPIKAVGLRDILRADRMHTAQSPQRETAQVRSARLAHATVLEAGAAARRARDPAAPGLGRR